VPSLCFTAALPANAQLFGEVAYFSHIGLGLPGRPQYDFGFAKDVATHVQFDVSGGLAPTPVSGQRNHYLAFGLSFGSL